MIRRRRLLHLSAAALLSALAASRTRSQTTDPSYPHRSSLPLVVRAPDPPTPTPTLPPTTTPATPVPTATPPAGDAPIVGTPTGTLEQAVAWLMARADGSYKPEGVPEIVGAYRAVGESVGMDWFTAIAQMCHETGHLTSFWSLRPQRNPAGIGVTGEWRPDPPPDPAGWAYNTQRGRWERGISFPTWAQHSVPAHLGRLLAYALRDDEATQAQRDLIATALGWRGLPDSLRGSARTWIGLNGRWAVPGTTYGQTILDLARRIREG